MFSSEPALHCTAGMPRQTLASVHPLFPAACDADRDPTRSCEPLAAPRTLNSPTLVRPQQQRVVLGGRDGTHFDPPDPWPTFFVLAPVGTQLPDAADLERMLAHWILRELSGWVQLVILDLLQSGTLEIRDDALVQPSGGPGRPIESRLLMVRCRDRRGPRRPGFWAALCVAEALAEMTGGERIDPRRAGLGLHPPRGLRPPADARVHAIDHVALPMSPEHRRGRWITTLGLAQFGLPDLELGDVPEPMTEIAARMLLGLAQHLIDGSTTPPRTDASERELLLTLAEIHWALGHDPSTMTGHRGRGWTRVGLRRWGTGTWTDLLRVQAPIGSRSRSRASWLAGAWLDLVGGPPDDTTRS